MDKSDNKGFFHGLLGKRSGGDKVVNDDINSHVPQGIPAPQEPTISAALVPPNPPVEQSAKPGMLERLKLGLKKTRENLVDRLDTIMLGEKLSLIHI